MATKAPAAKRKSTKGTPARGVGTGSAILPDLPGLVAAFWKGVKDGELLLQKCSNCGHHRHPPTGVCRACQSFDFDWVPSAGEGTLYSFTVIHHAVHPIVERWVPYTLCLVELDEGPRILSTVDTDRGEALAIGSRMQLRFRDIATDFRLPVFEVTGPPKRAPSKQARRRP